MLYAIIALLASLLGACCGLGGGVIVKPALDAFTDRSPAEISILSAFCVLVIAITGVLRYTVSRTPFDKKRCLFLGLGAVLGGFAGTKLLDLLLTHAHKATVVRVQSILLFLLLGAAILYLSFFKEKRSFHLEHPAAVILAGLLLGTSSAFLSIGGGPINVAVFVLLFSVSVKEAAVSSLAVILLSQLAKVGTLTFSGSLGGDLSPLFIMLPVAFVGALLGAFLHKKLPEKAVLILYDVAVCGIMALTFYNILA